MKKLFVLLISLVLLFSLFSCNNEVAKPNEPDQGGQTTEPEKPTLDIPSDFKPTEDTALSTPTDTDKEAIGKIIEGIQTITAEQAEPLIAEVFTAALQNGVTLNLPNSEAQGNEIYLKANGALSTDYTKLGLTANLKVSNYSIGDDVKANGKLIATVEIDFSKLSGNGNSRETGNVPPYTISVENGSDLKITIGSGDERYEITIDNEAKLESFINACQSKKIAETVFSAIMTDLRSVVTDALTIVKNFFANGYKLETEHFTVSVKGNLGWEFSDQLSGMGSKEASEEPEGSGEGSGSSTFGTFFKSITMTDLEILVSTNNEITLNDSGYQLRLVAKVSEAKMEPAKEKHYYNDGSNELKYIEYDGIKFSINADATLSILTTGRIGDNAIYAQGHFDGITGMFGEVDGQGKNYSAYLRFNGTDYNAVDLIGNIIASMKPSQGN